MIAQSSPSREYPNEVMLPLPHASFDMSMSSIDVSGVSLGNVRRREGRQIRRSSSRDSAGPTQFVLRRTLSLSEEENEARWKGANDAPVQTSLRAPRRKRSQPNLDLLDEHQVTGTTHADERCAKLNATADSFFQGRLVAASEITQKNSFRLQQLVHQPVGASAQSPRLPSRSRSSQPNLFEDSSQPIHGQ